MDVNALLDALGKLAGLAPVVAPAAGLIALLVDAAKKLGWLPDGRAPLASTVLNAILFVVLFLASDALKSQINDGLAAAYAAAPFVLGLLVSLLATAKAHKLFANAGLGFNHSAGNSGEVG